MTEERRLPILGAVHGRGAGANPPNRFVPIAFAPDPEETREEPGLRTRFFRDTTRRALVRNDSPDVGFEFSLNPYRGCEHGCIYCYARPSHEYLGLSAGLDFETKIFVKEQAPELLRKELASPKWRPAPVVLSGVTDPYQPVERRLELTRRCLRVMADFGNPVSVITKNQMVTRDADILGELAAESAARVNLSITSLDPEVQRVMEPRTSSPALRLKAVETLARAGIPVGVMVAPVVPGLTDHELPGILRAAADAGAESAGFVTLRLPYAVAALFDEWLSAHFPERRAKVLGRIRDVRGGRMNDPRFGSRMRGEGAYAEQIDALFRATCEKVGLNRTRRSLSTAAWRGAGRGGGIIGDQLSLF